VAGRVLQATRTVTFAALKPGLLLLPGRALAGEVVVADIGLGVAAARAGVVEAADVASWLPARPLESHKWRTAVLVVAGSPGMTGAAWLAASAAQRAGAGMVRVGSPGTDDDGGRPVEAVALHLPAEGWAETVSTELSRFRALVIGPGLGTAPATQAEVRAVLASSSTAAVVDADALTALGRGAGDLLQARTGPTVLTPHDGEHERLTGARPGPDRLDAARSLAAATGAVVLLKGSTTIVADPAGSVRIVLAPDARLATAGTGDVLSGVIGALLARGLPALEAASVGAWVHARAAELGAPEGLVAGDLPGLLVAAQAMVRR
jgi:hydroxyethylthiazole kinase-like uncharacterized protein yjeF